MSELQTTEQNYFIAKRESINGSIMLPTKPFLEQTYNFVKLAELKKDPNFVFLVGGWITQTSMLMQIKNPIDQFIKQDIVNMLAGYYSNLSLEEIVKAFEMERFGQFEEQTQHFQLFDSAYIALVLKKYIIWKKKQKTILNISPKMEETKLTQEEINAKMIEAVNNKYSEYLQNGDISEPFGHIFKELVEVGKLKMPTNETPKLYGYYQKKLEQATQQILEEHQNNKSEDKNERLKIKAVINDILQNEYSPDTKAKIELRAKKLVLLQFFESMKQNDVDKIL